MSLTKTQKMIALEDYNSDVKPLSEKRLDWCIKHTANYIYTDKKNGVGFCTKCEKKVILPKTKHMENIKCPNCHKNMKILHTHRRHWLEDRNNWIVFPEIIDEYRLRLRYVLVSRYGVDPEPQALECARMVIDLNSEKEYTFELWDKEWKYSTWNYFRETGMCYSYRTLCCLQAELYPYGLKQIEKLNAFKNIKLTKQMFEKLYVSSCIFFMEKRTDLYEKLSKVGLNALIHDDLNSYYTEEIKYDNTQTSLTKMLGIDKLKLRLLKNYPTRKALAIMQEYPVNEKNISHYSELEFDSYIISKIQQIATENTLKLGKVRKYILSLKNEHGLYDTLNTYINYLDKLKYLGYPLDNNYCFPKDFNKDETRINNEYGDKLDNERIEKLTKNYELKKEQVKEYILSIKGDATVYKVTTEYENYIDKLKMLEYPLSDENIFPVDFEKKKDEINKIYRENQKLIENKKTLEKIKKEAAKVKIIKKIAEYIKNNKELILWMQGSEGLKVIVPETPDELYREGIELHNCLSKYAEKIADKETLVFFIHKLDDVNKAYVAMEYKNGEVNALMYDNNVEVEDDKIISFASAFADKLKELEVEKEIKKVA